VNSILLELVVIAHEVIKTKHKAAYDFCILPYSKLLTIEIIILSNTIHYKTQIKANYNKSEN
jgi:hypothetical protein